MPNSTAPRPRHDLHEDVTAKLIAAIEANPTGPQLPWRQSASPLGLPRNALTRKSYNGINIIALWSAAFIGGHATPTWATYQQWASLRAQVRKGEKGTAVAFFKDFKVDPNPDDVTDDGNRRVMRTSIVFNVSQVSGYSAPTPSSPLPVAVDPWEPRPAAEQFIARTGAEIQHGGSQAYYERRSDHIQMPPRTDFIGTSTSTSLESYYEVVLHELGHWSGGPKRLNRTFGERFGDQAYAAEELVAELTSAFLCAELNITAAPRVDHSQYLGHWLKLLRQDSRAIFVAAAKASEAVRFLAGGATVTIGADRAPPAGD